jgi:hypothetical protein
MAILRTLKGIARPMQHREEYRAALMAKKPADIAHGGKQFMSPSYRADARLPWQFSGVMRTLTLPSPSAANSALDPLHAHHLQRNGKVYRIGTAGGLSEVRGDVLPCRLRTHLRGQVLHEFADVGQGLYRQ